MELLLAILAIFNGAMAALNVHTKSYGLATINSAAFFLLLTAILAKAAQ